jgi:IPT/TIG domain/Viral BACON domain
MHVFRCLVASLCLVLLAACGGGGGGGGGNNTSISASPGSVSFAAAEGGAGPAAAPVRINFVGDGVIVGYAPGVPAPSWLTVTTQTSTATTADFLLSVVPIATPSTLSTTVRFVTGRADGSDVKFIELPVTYTVSASDLSLTAAPATLTFSATTQGVLPAPKSVTATFNGDSLNVSVINAPSWLTVTPSSPATSPATYAVAVNSTNMPVGTFVGEVVFRTTRAGTTVQRESRVRVEYNIVEPFNATAATPLSFEAVRGSSQAPQPIAGYQLAIHGALARWRISTAPSWLSFSATSGTGPATVVVTANASGQQLGVTNAQVIVTDDDSGSSRTFAASLNQRAARLTASPASIEFELDASSPASAISQNLTISDELNGALLSESVSWTVQPISEPWLKTSVQSGSSSPTTQIAVSLDEQELETLRSGDRAAQITLSYQNAQGGNQTLTVPVTLRNRLAHVQYVAPYIGLAGTAGTLVVRGTDFTTVAAAVNVMVGTTEITSLVPDSDTQLTLNYPALSAGRYPVSIRNAAGIASTEAELVVATIPAYTYQAIDAPSNRSRIVLDAERQVLYGVNELDQQIERYAFSAGIWSASSSYVLPELTDVALAPNGRSLVALTRNSISDIDLVSGPFIAEPRAANPDPHCGSYFDQLSILNNGKAFIVFNLGQCSGFTPSYLYDLYDHSVDANSYFAGWLYNGIAAASADGSRVYAGSNGVSPAQPVKILNALSNSITDSGAAYNLNAVTVSGNASRVILQNEVVYSRALTVTGNLPAGGVVLASRDSSRAFVYRDDGGQPRIVVHNLNGALLPGAVYPVLKTVALVDSPTTNAGEYLTISMAATPDDATVFVSGNRRILVVPVN